MGVAKLEVDAGAGGSEAKYLADQLDPGELLQAALEPRRVGADRIGPGKRLSGIPSVLGAGVSATGRGYNGAWSALAELGSARAP